MNITIQQYKKQAASQLMEVSPSPQLDVDVLLQYSLKINKTQLLLQANNPIPQENLNWLNQAIEKRKTGFPIAYITGHKDFYGYDFVVTPAVLIPKPDTEILVERGIELILEKMEAHPNNILTICDMCTGSGCIGLSVMRQLIDVYKVPYEKLPKFTLVDISQSALEIAQKNADLLLEKQARSQIRFVQSNLFEHFNNYGGISFDVILTNPPYVPHSMVEELLKDGRKEPVLALDGDITLFGDRAYDENGDEQDDGLEIIRNLLPQAKSHLSPLGIILMETGEYNAEAAAQLAEKIGFSTQIHKDLEGQLRTVECLAKN